MRMCGAKALLSAAFAFAIAMAPVHAGVWQPSAGHVQVPIWPEGKVPDPQPVPGPETVRADWPRIENVSVPTMTVYAPEGTNTGTAVVVFPGGGFQMLAMDLEGTEVCDWLVSKGITCVLLKYRVPGAPYDWHCDCRPHNRDLSMPSLQDAQRTLGLVRLHAKEWGIDPHRIGVIELKPRRQRQQRFTRRSDFANLANAERKAAKVPIQARPIFDTCFGGRSCARH